MRNLFSIKNNHFEEILPGAHYVHHARLVGTGDVDNKRVRFGNSLTLKIFVLLMDVIS